MTTLSSDLTTPVSAETYAQILQFYAQHMRKIDEGAAEDWAADFTEDGVFAQNVKPDPWQGREFIATSMRRGIDRLASKGLVRRHWFGMVSAYSQEDGSAYTRYCAVVFETPQGGKSSVYLSTTGEDVLVHKGGRWLVLHRRIAHDGTE